RGTDELHLASCVDALRAGTILARHFADTSVHTGVSQHGRDQAAVSRNRASMCSVAATSPVTWSSTSADLVYATARPPVPRTASVNPASRHARTAAANPGRWVSRRPNAIIATGGRYTRSVVGSSPRPT